MGILTNKNLTTSSHQPKPLTADDWATRSEKPGEPEEKTIEILCAPEGSENDPDNLTEKFSALPKPWPCEKCSCPIFWITVYDSTGADLRCQGCEPIPSRGLVQLRLFVLDDPPRWCDWDAEQARHDCERGSLC